MIWAVEVVTVEYEREGRIDRGYLRIDSLFEPSDEKDFWLSKSPAERLLAVEQMRQIIYGYYPPAPRLSRFFEITKRISG